MQPVKKLPGGGGGGGGWSVYPEVRVLIIKKKAGPDMMGAEPGGRRSGTEGMARQKAVQARWMECRGWAIAAGKGQDSG